MTLAEILALPVQTNKRLLTASDTGDEYLIRPGSSGAGAKKVIILQNIDAWSVDPPYNSIPVGIKLVGSTDSRFATYYYAGRIGDYGGQIFYKPFNFHNPSFPAPPPGLQAVYFAQNYDIVGEGRWTCASSLLGTGYASDSVPIGTSLFGLDLYPYGLAVEIVQIEQFSGQDATVSNYSAEEKLVSTEYINDLYKNFGTASLPWWKKINTDGSRTASKLERP